MPPPNKKQKACSENFCKRTDQKTKVDENNNHDINLDQLNESLEEIEQFTPSENEEKCDCNCHKKNIQVREFGTQTEEFPNSGYVTELVKHFNMTNVRDLLCIFFDSIANFNFKHKRLASVIIYLLLRLVRVQFESCRSIMESLNLLTINTSHSWILTIIDEDDLSVILRDLRGSHKHITFYENYPQLELEAKSFALTQASLKKCSFIVEDLAKFVDQRFREIYADLLADVELDESTLIRSVESCRSDLIIWGARYDKNSNRPYFEGNLYLDD